jgi:ATPase subunit of ABC transporter with duplicated ATPase domains
VVRPKRVGILSQNQFAFDAYRVLDTVIMGNKSLWAALEERDALYSKLDMTDEDGMRLGELEGVVAENDGYTAESDAAILLDGLDIPEALHERKMSELQGGQKVRVLVAQALFGSPAALLLDEPTNHLDLRAKEVLLEAIRNFSGTVIFVSHDRYFLDALGTRVFEVEGGTVHVYPGNYEDYMRRKAGVPDPVVAAAAASQAVVEAVENNGRARRVNPIKRKQMQDRLKLVEAEIPRVETAIAETEQALGNFVSAEETQRQSVALEGLRSEHTTLSAEWEDLVQQLEEQASV